MNSTHPPTPVTPTPVTPAPALGQTLGRGASWMVGGTIATKLLNSVAQIILAYLLLDEDFGLVGLAGTVVALASLVQTAGLREILLHRQRHFHRWVNPAFWMSVTAGLLAGGLIAAFAPLSGVVYDTPTLPWLVLVFAAGAPLAAICTVPLVHLQLQLRFKAIASIAFTMAAVTTALTILLAWLGFGAWSFALPPLVVHPIRFVVALSLAGTPLRFKAQVRRWKYLIGDAGTTLAAGFFGTLTMQGDYFVLGLLYDKGVVGTYFFAFGLSRQVMTLLTQNLSTILLPAFSKLRDEPERQRAAFLRAVRTMLAVAVPLCLLQAALADPLLRLLFGDKWVEAIPILQVLSFGIATGMANTPAINLLQSHGRFRTVLFITITAAALSFAGWFPGAVWAEGFGVAVGGFVAASITSALCVVLAYTTAGGRKRDLLALLRAPLAALISVGAAWTVGVFLVSDLPVSSQVQFVLQIFAILLLTFVLYVFTLRRLDPVSYRDARKFVRQRLKRFAG